MLSPDGVLLILAQTPEEAAKAPYTRHGFRNYAEAQLRQLHTQAGFRRVEIELYRDTRPTWDRSGTTEFQAYFVIAFA